VSELSEDEIADGLFLLPPSSNTEREMVKTQSPARKKREKRREKF